MLEDPRECRGFSGSTGRSTGIPASQPEMRNADADAADAGPFFSHTCARYNKVENEFPNDTNEEEQLTEGSEPYFPLPAFPQDDIWPELLEKIISYSKKTK